MNFPKKYLSIIIFLSFILVLGAVCISFQREAMEIYDKTLRLHILANSDSERDQALKLKVRDAVLDCLSGELATCNTKAEAEETVVALKNEIEDVARETMEAYGVDYAVNLTVTEEYYPRREYEGITLPAGNYTSVRILIGESEGQNWWCVLFPQVCTDTATPADEKLAQVGFTPSQIRLLTKQEEPEYRVKFKIVELIEALFGR
ncbi:MAG: stage II sporulation protein R [Clostridia bacterium]|nr:stage II sporulation protein R [Clostridia bacterium]